MQRRSDNPGGPGIWRQSGVVDDLDPAIRSWVDNCLVPILVKEFLASRQVDEELASGAKPMQECGAKESSSDEVAQ